MSHPHLFEHFSAHDPYGIKEEIAARLASVTAEERALVSKQVSNVYLAQFEHTKDLQFLDGAISYIKKAKDETPQSGSNAVEYATIESELMIKRLNLTTTMAKVDEHIRALERQHSGELEIRVEDAFRDKIRSSNFKTLASAYFKRFELSNDMADLNRAIALFQEHTKLTSPVSIHVGCNLGNALHRRFTIQRSPDDLDHAAKILRAAVDSLPSHMPDANAFKSLASVLFIYLLFQFNACTSPVLRSM
jgi:tetratricopeptide (TPR) repeat protein